MKKVLSLAIALALIIMPFSVLAGGGIVLPIDVFDDKAGTVTLSQPGNCNSGDTVTVTVSYNRNAAGALNFDVDYDSAYLTLTGVTSLRAGWDASNSGNSVTITKNGGSAISGATALVQLTFAVDRFTPDSSFTITALNCSDGKYVLANAACSFNVTYTALIGDVNDDKTVDEADLLLLTRAIANWKDYDIENIDTADINADGNITPKDRAILARYLDGWSEYDIYFD